MTSKPKLLPSSKGMISPSTATRSHEMEGVREHAEGFPVELASKSGRLVVRAYNEAGYSATEIDLLDLLDWLQQQKFISRRKTAE